MADLAEELERLGLSEYLEILVAEGFDAWETVLDITESDLWGAVASLSRKRVYIYNRNSLNVKIGHRRVCAVMLFDNVTALISSINRNFSGRLRNRAILSTTTALQPLERKESIRDILRSVFLGSPFLPPNFTIRQTTDVLVTLFSQTSMHPGDLYLPMQISPTVSGFSSLSTLWD